MNHRDRLFVVLAFGFILLGMSVTLQGVTWPPVAESFDRALAELGYVALLFGGGYTVSSFLSTLSRFPLGAMGERLSPDRILRWSAASTAIAFTVLWWSPFDWLSAVALIVAGFAHGPIFPLKMLLTPRRFGEALTASVVGFEIAAANVCGALLPGLMGAAVGIWGLSVLPPLLVANSLVRVGTVEMPRRQNDGQSSIPGD